MALPGPPPFTARLKPNCPTPEGGLIVSMPVSVMAVEGWTPVATYGFDTARFGYQNWAQVSCDGSIDLVGYDSPLPSPEIEFCLQLGIGAQPEPIAYGSWKSPARGNGGLVVQVTGLQFDTLGFWTRLADRSVLGRSLKWQVQLGTGQRGTGGVSLEWGRFTVPGK